MARLVRYLINRSQVRVEPATERLGLGSNGLWITISTISTGLLIGVIGLMIVTGDSPRMLALKEENKVFREQLVSSAQRFETILGSLDELTEKDKTLYSILLETDVMSDDVLQVGVGGSDPYAPFDRFRSASAELLRGNAQRLDELERRINLQSRRYQALVLMGRNRSQALREMPAIMPADGNVVSTFGRRLHPVLNLYRQHEGVDIPLAEGSPIYSTGAGVVQSVENAPSSLGLNIIIAHPNAGYKTLYAHLSKFAPGIRPGKHVRRGEKIGESGNTGLSAGPHVHYEVHDWSDRPLNPLHFFAPALTPKQYKALLAADDTVSLD